MLPLLPLLLPRMLIIVGALLFMSTCSYIGGLGWCGAMCSIHEDHSDLLFSIWIHNSLGHHRGPAVHGRLRFIGGLGW